MKVKQQTNKRKAEPRAPLCPLAGFRECRRRQCALWDDDWTLCSLNYGSLYSSIRVAVCDAAVEVIGEYRGEGDRGTSSVTGCAGDTFPDAKLVLQNTGGRPFEDGEAGA